MSILLTVQVCWLVAEGVTKKEKQSTLFTHRQVLAHFSLFLMVSNYRKKNLFRGKVLGFTMKSQH